MPRAIIVVSTVPGTVAASQSLVLNPVVERLSGVAETLGAAASFHPPASTQSELPAGCKVVCAGGSGSATGLLNGALRWGSVAGSCGAVLPTNWRTCNAHGLEPSSNAISGKSGLCAARAAMACPESASRVSVNKAMRPPKWSQNFSMQGDSTGAIISCGWSGPAWSGPCATSTPST